MQAATMTAAFVIRMHKQRPDIAIDCVANGETDNDALILGDPPPARQFDGRNVVLFGNECRDKAILMDRHADAVHAWDVCSPSQPYAMNCLHAT